jgi:hypothetical protein
MQISEVSRFLMGVPRVKHCGLRHYEVIRLNPLTRSKRSCAGPNPTFALYPHAPLAIRGMPLVRTAGQLPLSLSRESVSAGPHF